MSETPSLQPVMFFDREVRAAGRADAVAIESGDGFDRRQFLKLMAASLALAGAGACSRPPRETIHPFVEAPPHASEGEPRYYATATTLSGIALGVLVENNMGRPTKIEGNPLHPGSLGATDAFAQASVLDLWDPRRSAAVTHGGAIATWADFTDAVLRRRERWTGTHGDGLRILTGTVTSPTLAAQIGVLLQKFPQARWHRYEPLHRDAVYEGARMAFGAAVETVYRFDRARVALSLDADFIATGPGRVRHARDWMRRRADAKSAAEGNRLYAIGPAPTLTSAVADHALPLRAGAIEDFARLLARRLDIDVPAAGDAIPAAASRWLAACAAELAAHRGESVIVAGDRQPAFVHALAHVMNHALGNIGNTVFHTDPVCADARSHVASIDELTQDAAAGRVDTLLIIGANPVYDAPADLALPAALQRVALKIRAGVTEDETSARCDWHLPLAHYLEAWSDARAHDGTVTIQQPAIAPLHDSKSAHEVLALFEGGALAPGYDIVRGHWQQAMPGSFDERWTESLRNGVVADSALPPKAMTIRKAFLAQSPTRAAHPAAGALEIDFMPDSSVWDGRFAGNAWLQELPRALTRLTWDNAALIAPALAARLGLNDGDVVELQRGARTLRIPVLIAPGHADGALSVALGYGRTRAGSIGNGCGADAYRLRTSDAQWFAADVTLRPTGERHALAITQHHHRMEGRDIVRSFTLAGLARQAAAVKPPEPKRQSLYPPVEYPRHAWGMAIDLAACIGCNACTIACQAENNIPVVGKAEVERGREMHWIRVDRYDEGDASLPRTHFQPVPCMHCEHAPCEVVCPVGASIHDSEGLNVQVYNRCVGTRFCSNNCPYKVRRFNFYQYADRDTESLKAQRNPEVTVRSRGVMEKCTYCVQRISAARREAEKANRAIRDGEVVTACQAVCPTRAITFGDLNDPASAVVAAKASPRNYTLLEELNTRPRTTYLAKVTNPDPQIADADAVVTT